MDIHCPTCEKPFTVSEEHYNQEVNCPGCDQSLFLEKPEDQADSAPDEITSTVSEELQSAELKGNLAFKVAKFGLYISLGLCVLMIVSSLMQIQLLKELNQGVYSEQKADANDLREGMIGLAWIFDYLFIMIFVSVWIYKAHKNAIHYGIVKDYSAGWAVGSFFVPVANLIYPYRAMKELYQCSKDPTNWRTTQTNFNLPLLLPFWWSLWIVNNFYDWGLFRYILRVNDPTIEQLIKFTYADIISTCIHVVLAVVFLKLISSVRKYQEDNFLSRYI